MLLVDNDLKQYEVVKKITVEEYLSLMEMKNRKDGRGNNSQV